MNVCFVSDRAECVCVCMRVCMTCVKMLWRKQFLFSLKISDEKVRNSMNIYLRARMQRYSYFTLLNELFLRSQRCLSLRVENKLCSAVWHSSLNSNSTTIRPFLIVDLPSHTRSSCVCSFIVQLMLFNHNHNLIMNSTHS